MITPMEKSKAEKSPWVKKKKKPGPKKKEKAQFCQAKKKNLAESDKGSWFGQTPSTSSASAEDPERPKTLGASSLKIEVNVSAGCEQDSSLESGESDKEKECFTNGPKHWSIVDRDELNRQLAIRVNCRFCQSKGVNFEEVARAELVLDAGVSIDGSWNQRGWSARDGVVAVISIDTGKVLLSCHETYPRELISAMRVLLKLSFDSLTYCSSAEHFPPLTLLAWDLPLPLRLASLPIIFFFSITWS